LLLGSGVFISVSSQAARVWLVNGNDADNWVPAVVDQCDGVEVVYRTDYGDVSACMCSWFLHVHPCLLVNMLMTHF